MKCRHYSLRFTAVAFALSSFGVGFTQAFELRAGAGATLSGNVFTVAPGPTFDAEIWMTGAAGTTVNTYSVALALDRTNGSGTSATCLDNRLGVTSYVNHIATFDQLLSSNELRAAATVVGTGNNYGFASGALRPYVSYSVFGSLGSFLTLDGNAVHVGTVTIYVAGLGNGVYGDDANEAGLFLANQGDYSSTYFSPQNGASGWVSPIPSNSRRFGSVKYMVTAVPEPMTMVGVALALGAFRLRRRTN